MALTPPFARFSLVPAAQGLYDPAAEKDACGLAMVATLRGTAGHDIITAALDALRHLEHRGAVGSDAGTGDGAGIITQIPDAFLRAVAAFELPAVGRVRRRQRVPARSTPTARSRVKRRHRAARRQTRASSVLGWREVPVRPDELGTLARAAMPVVAAAVRAVRRAPTSSGAPLAGIALDRLTFRLRKRAERELELYFAVAVVPHPRLQGHGHDAPARAVLPRPLRRALRLEARARALALLHEHLPVVAARAAVPHDRAQRRDQHHPGQPQLDARAPVAARVRAARRPRARSCRSSRPARATRRRSTRSSSC